MLWMVFSMWCLSIALFAAIFLPSMSLFWLIQHWRQKVSIIMMMLVCNYQVSLLMLKDTFFHGMFVSLAILLIRYLIRKDPTFIIVSCLALIPLSMPRLLGAEERHSSCCIWASHSLIRSGAVPCCWNDLHATTHAACHCIIVCTFSQQKMWCCNLTSSEQCGHHGVFTFLFV